MKRNKPVVLANLYGFTGRSYAGNVYDVGGIAPNILSTKGGNKQPIVVVIYEV